MVQMTDVPGFQLPKCEEFIDDPAVQDFRGVCPGFTPSFGEYIPHEFLVWDLSGSVGHGNITLTEKVGSGSLSFATWESYGSWL